MSESEFARMRSVLSAPSPVGMEAAMTHGVLLPWFKEFMPSTWGVHTFQGNAGMVVDTHPGREDMLKVMVMGHADKIRCQVRSVAADGKVYIESDSFLPLTLLGNEVVVFSESEEKPGTYRTIRGATVEALGAIHFSTAQHRQGTAGVKKQQLYLEFGLHGDRRKAQVERLGIKPGDAVLLDRPIRRGLAPHSFTGAYLDNGLGCFVAGRLGQEIAARWSARGPLEHVRCLFAFSAFEEIGRFGSRVIASSLRPDALVAADVNHDFDAAPLVGDQRFTPLKMGAGFTLAVGSVATPALNSLILRAARDRGVPVQRAVCGRDTGTDAMAGVLGNIDCAAASVGFPIRNMHTVSETGHTGDVMAAVYALAATVEQLERERVGRDYFRAAHPRLDLAAAAEWIEADDGSTEAEAETEQEGAGQS